MASLPKKFYKSASVIAPDNNGFAITLDDRLLKTPDGLDYLLPNLIIAQIVAEEWNSQSDKGIAPDTMPIHSIAVTAIDKASDDREATMVDLHRYLDGDLLCYMTDHPENLAALQKEIWGATVDLFNRHYQTDLKTTQVLVALRQPQLAHDALDQLCATQDQWQFCAFQILVAATGSVILAMLAFEKLINEAVILKSVFLEDDFYNAIYLGNNYDMNKDEAQKRLKIENDIHYSLQFFDHLNPSKN